MPLYRITAGYKEDHGTTLDIEAPDLSAACREAVNRINSGAEPTEAICDSLGPTHVWCCHDSDDPAADLPVPEEFAEPRYEELARVAREIVDLWHAKTVPPSAMAPFVDELETVLKTIR